MVLAEKNYIKEKINFVLYKIINALATVTNKKILIPAFTRTRSKHGHPFHIMTKNTHDYKYPFFPETMSQ